MEEIIEMITWKQMGIHGKPIVLANIAGYFQPLLQQFEVAIRHKFARTEDRILFGVAENDEGDPDVSGRGAGDVAKGGGLGLGSRALSVQG